MKKKQQPAPAVTAPPPPPSALQTQATGISEEERAARNAGIEKSGQTAEQAKGTVEQAKGAVTSGLQNLQGVRNTVDQAKGALTETNPLLNRFTTTDATGSTPFRRALLNTKSQSTSNAYDNAAARQR